MWYGLVAMCLAGLIACGAPSDSAVLTQHQADQSQPLTSSAQVPAPVETVFYTAPPCETCPVAPPTADTSSAPPPDHAQ